MPQEIELTATRFATIGTLTPRSCAMSRRNGARVVPLAPTVNMASCEAVSSAHGRRSDRASRPGTRRLVESNRRTADMPGGS